MALFDDIRQLIRLCRFLSLCTYNFYYMLSCPTGQCDNVQLMALDMADKCCFHRHVGHSCLTVRSDPSFVRNGEMQRRGEET
jgi:hypothetical protein